MNDFNPSKNGTGLNCPVAIVGMGCIFPKSPGLKDYWRLLFRGGDAVTEVPDTHWSPADYFNSDPSKPDHVYCKRGGFVSPVMFDPSEFGIPPASLDATDTSQLLGLVAAKAALDDAGYLERNFDRERASVILGVTGTQELVIPLGSRLGFPKWRKALLDAGVDPGVAEHVIERIGDEYVPWKENSFPGLLGNVVAGRICNRLDFGGTNCVVDAACASSLGAVHLALMELVGGRSDMVVTGGVDMLNDIFMHMCFSRTQILSPTGDARPFSEDADGTVIGEGIGMLVLKRLDDAENDGDRIYAVIKSLGTSSDGKSQSIYAPRAEGQAKALRAAYETADIDPATVGLVEAHGTGTRVGDMVEFNALKQVFGEYGADRNGDRCAIGSVKSMIGHTKAAAGSAGLIKAALSVFHKVLPPTLKADKPDKKLGIEDSPFYINTQTRPWFAKNGHPRRSGVSSFGFGGSNFHLVLEEYGKHKSETAWDGSVEIAAFSADSREKLSRLLNEFRQAFESEASEKAKSAQLAKNRAAFSPNLAHRLLIVLERPFDMQVFERAQKALEPGHVPDRRNADVFYGTGEKPGKLAFLFPGQGSQYTGMGKDLACAFPEALRVMEMTNEQFGGDHRLTDHVYPYPALSEDDKKKQEETLRRTQIAQPAIGAVSMSMAEILSGFGVRPDAAAGHSFGELTALYAAGRIDADAFRRLAVLRGSLMAKAGKDGEKGTMLAVAAPLDEIARLASETGVVLANLNSPGQGVLSGPEKAIAQARKKCAEKGFRSTNLPVSAAFHSSLVEDAKTPFSKALEEIDIAQSDIPVFSNTTGGPYPADPGQAGKILGGQIVNPVNFAGQIENMYEAGVRIFIEIGPKSVLTGLVSAILKGRDFHAFSTDGSAGRRNGFADLAGALCRLGALGCPVRLDKWESPISEPKKQRMQIPLSGANYRPKSEKKKPAKPAPPKKMPKTPEPAPTAAKPVETPAVAGTVRAVGAKPAEIKTKPIENKNSSIVMENKNRNTSYVVEDALKVLQEGMKSMQALQLQTAETHKKFLETQTETGKTLRMMMEQTQRLAETSVSPGVAYTPALVETRFEPPADKAKAEIEIPIQAAAPEPPPPVQTVPVAKPPAKQVEKREPAPTETKPKGDSRGKIETAILDVVSELTGYPVEMLSMDMDIEADLGIDSIKRVEILSTMEEKMPHLPAVSPEIMGTLRTLSQVCDYLNEGGETNAVTESPAPAPKKTEGIETAILEIVSELTGYPTEMLALDMDIEADLGIDSIKRVEILSTMEEKMPHLPAVSPEVMGTLRTLAQIVQYLSDSSGETVSSDEGGENSVEPEVSDGLTENVLIEIVSQLTGYPVETLSPDMDLESDLGIDSIKRVEILSALEEQMPHLPAVSPDMMGTLRTLGQIAGFLNKSQDTGEQPVVEAEPVVRKEEGSDKKGNVARQIVTVVEQPFVPGAGIRIPAGRTVYVTRGGDGLCDAIVQELQAIGINAAVTTDENESLSPAGGLVILPSEGGEAFVKKSFATARRFAPDMIESAKQGGAVFATVSRLDGAFGFRGKGISDPLQGALAGLAKTAAVEWPGVRCLALDAAPNWNDTSGFAKAIVREITGGKGPVEVGLDHEKRFTLSLESAPSPKGEIDLSPGDAVVVTGGARGVTAATALALAEHAKPALVLLGRSPLPEPEPPWLASLTDEASIKKAIMANEFGGNVSSPIQLEQSYKKHMAGREIADNLEKLKSTGAKISYYSADVRDSESVESVLEKVRAEHGPIKALIHGAGTLEDRLIVDKTDAQFEKVFDTKVGGLGVLLGALDKDDLKYLVLFSSVAARFGNKGQADYAMANEAMNKIAQLESANRPDCRVVSINWGPWDGGMVTPSLRREFEKNGIDLIPMDEGAKFLPAEMMGTKNDPVEVVVGARIVSGDSDAKVSETEKESLLLSFKREIDVDRYPILGAHVLDGKPVVPFALLAEWLGHGALHGNPGLTLHGLDDMRILHGLKLGRESKLIRLLAGKARKSGAMFEVNVELRDGYKDGKELIHTRAKALLTYEPPEPFKFGNSLDIERKTYTRSMDDVYENILFHGDELRGIREIIACNDRMMIARLNSAPSPEQWMKDPLRSSWIADPLVLDAAFQMSIVWCYEQAGMVSLPSYNASYRQYCGFPTEGVTAILEIREADKRKMVGDFTFVDSENHVVAKIEGSESLMDKSLFKAFERRHIDR